jgi:hypothetical protein
VPPSPPVAETYWGALRVPRAPSVKPGAACCCLCLFAWPPSGTPTSPGPRRRLFNNAGSNAARRSVVLKRYRSDVVRPALLERDAIRYQKAALPTVPNLGVSFSSLQPAVHRLPVEFLELDLGPLTWRFFRAWCLVRCTGCWPLTCYGLRELAPTLPSCPLCMAVEVTVMHCLGPCPGTAHHLGHFASAIASTSPAVALLRSTGSPPDAMLQIEAVGRCVHAVLARLHGSAGPADEHAEFMTRADFYEGSAVIACELDSDSDGSSSV